MSRSSRPVQIWDGTQPEWAISLSQPIRPPAHLCFETNYDETVTFFEYVRQAITPREGTNRRGFITRRAGRLPRISGYTDFSKTNIISTAAAVVLAAEYERGGVLNGAVPPTVELLRWNTSVFRTLYELGFFEIVGLVENITPPVTGNHTTRTMRIVSSKTADDLAIIDTSLQELGQFLFPGTTLSDEVIIEFLTALSEAISNVTNHAYPEDHTFSYRHIGSLWVAASADRASSTLTVVVYDQGATIPVTYPRLSRVGKAVRFLSSALRREKGFENEDDGTYIRAAMKYGRSSTNEPHRGRGFPQIADMVSRLGSGSLSIYSRGGWCRRDVRGRYKSGSSSQGLGGTLIQWSVSLSPRAAQEVGGCK